MEINKDYVINSLTNQNAKLALQIAERDAIIAELQNENEQLKEVEEMNKEY